MNSINMHEKTTITAGLMRLPGFPSLTDMGLIGRGVLILMGVTAGIATLVSGGSAGGEGAALLARDLCFLALLCVIVRIITKQIQSGFAALEERMSRREENLKSAVTDLSVENSQLALLSTTDFLTGARNRRYFDDALDREWERSVQLGYSLALALVDVDRFKMINDAYGHAQGDECLVQVSGALRSKMQHPGHVVARYGGDEFAVLMPNVSEAGIQSVLEDVREQVARLTSAPAVGLSISAGAVTCWPTSGLEPKRLVRLADEQLYAAKRAGRNRVSVGAVGGTIAI